MAAQTDLWGEIVPGVERTPLSILREQASLLGKKTKNLIQANVDTSVAPWKAIVHGFRLVVPSLDNYTYELFRVSHKLDCLYPVNAVGGEELSTEEEFVDWLGRKLSSEETKKLVQTLLAQVTT